MCFEYKVISVEYFLDECTLWEINNIVENIPYTDRSLWESQRLVTYAVAKANFKGIGGMTDFIQFPWDVKQTTTKTKPKPADTSISNEDIARLRGLAQKFIDENKTNGESNI